MKYRSIRIRLTFWYAVVMLVGLTVFGLCSLLVLHYAVATSRQSTLLRREERLLAFTGLRLSSNDRRSVAERLALYSQFAPEGELIQVYDSQHRLLFPSAQTTKLTLQQKQCAQPCFFESDLGDHRIRILHQLVYVDGQKLELYVGGSMTEHDSLVNAYRSALLIMIPCIAMLSLAGGYTLSSRALRPLNRLTQASSSISIRSLSERLPVPHTGDEVQHLAEAFNALLNRLDSAVSQLSQFTADASHDLRTSITIMLTTGQLALKRPRSEVEYREALDSMVGECRSTADLLDGMLTLARADAYTLRIVKNHLDLRDVVEETCRRMQTLAHSKHQTFCYDLPPCIVPIDGNGELLERLAGILVDNAIKYTPEGGCVRVSLEPHRHRPVLRIEDTGIGIAPELVPRIFDRFFRADRSRSTATAGNGLGLAIAKWIAEAHMATILVESEPAKGTVFSVKFARV